MCTLPHILCPTASECAFRPIRANFSLNFLPFVTYSGQADLLSVNCRKLYGQWIQLTQIIYFALTLAAITWFVVTDDSRMRTSTERDQQGNVSASSLAFCHWIWYEKWPSKYSRFEDDEYGYLFLFYPCPESAHLHHRSSISWTVQIWRKYSSIL